MSYNIVSLLIDKQIENGLGEKTAVIDPYRQWTYADIVCVMSYVDKLLNKFDIQPGNTIACLFHDSGLSVGCFLGIIRRGNVACYLNPYASKKDTDYYLKCCNARVILVDSTLSNVVVHVNLPVIIVETHKINIELYHPALKKVPHTGSPTRNAFYLFTSGTTGMPSLVPHRHIDIENTNKSYAQSVIRFTSDDIIFSTSKLFFAYGLNSIVYSFYHGATAIIGQKKLKDYDVWRHMRKYQVSVFFSVPTVYSMLLFKNDIPSLPKLRMAISAGEHLPEKIQKSWIKIFRSPIIDGIGTTEILSTFISNTKENFKLNSTGIPVNGFKIKICDEGNNRVKKNTIGILWVKGDTYNSYYHNNPQMTENRFKDGWFKTNDLFYVDDDGYYYYCGRSNDIIKCGGVWIYPYKIEKVIQQHPAVKECAVIGKKQDNDLYRPVAIVVLNVGCADNDQTKESIKQFSKKHCSYYEYPHYVYISNEIPKTDTGKKKRYLLAKEYMSHDCRSSVV